MNAAFKTPVIDALRGGKKHGGATLTAAGERVLRIYNQMERKAIDATRADWTALRSLLRN
jgi:molybdate transport system regulatory protein